jgi:hypothetical protein
MELREGRDRECNRVTEIRAFCASVTSLKWTVAQPDQLTIFRFFQAVVDPIGSTSPDLPIAAASRQLTNCPYPVELS